MGLARTEQQPLAAGVWRWTHPLRRIRQRRKRFASVCFLSAGLAFGSALYLVATRADHLRMAPYLSLFVLLTAAMVLLTALGAGAESEVTRIEQEIADLEAEATRLLRYRN